MLDKIFNALFGGSKGVVISKEQREELSIIENEAYMEEAKKLARQKGELLAKRKFDEMTKQ